MNKDSFQRNIEISCSTYTALALVECATQAAKACRKKKKKKKKRREGIKTRRR